MSIPLPKSMSKATIVEKVAHTVVNSLDQAIEEVERDAADEDDTGLMAIISASLVPLPVPEDAKDDKDEGGADCPYT